MGEYKFHGHVSIMKIQTKTMHFFLSFKSIFYSNEIETKAINVTTLNNEK